MWQSIWVHNIPFKQVMKDYWTMSTKCLMRMAKWFTTSKGMANMDKTMKLWLMFPLRNVLHLKLKLAWEKEKKKENKSSHSIYISQTSNHWNERRGHVHEIGGFSCSVVGEKMKIYKIKLKSLKRNHQNWNMHWKEDILQRNTRENKGRRKTSTEDTTCVDSALGLGLDPHGAAFGPPVFTQELERSKPWACNRKQLGKERNITLCKPYSSHSSVLQAIKVGTLQTHQHLELLGQPEFSGACRDFESRGLYLTYIQNINPVNSSGLAGLSGMFDIQKLSSSWKIPLVLCSVQTHSHGEIYTVTDVRCAGMWGCSLRFPALSE